MFQTFVGFEDIWFYMDFENDDLPKVKQLIRDLNTADLNAVNPR